MPDFGRITGKRKLLIIYHLAAFIAGKIPKSVSLPVPASPLVDLQSTLLKHAYDAPPLGIGAAVYQNKTTMNYTAIMLFNGAAIHTSSLSLSLLSNAILKDSAG